MDLQPNMVSRWVLASTLLVAGSCAPVSQRGLSGTDPAPYDVAAAERTLVFGYTSITERHLEETNAAGVALDGMRGLAAIDPTLTVTRLDNKVLLSVANHQAAEYPAPADTDIDGWAHLTMAVAIDARAESSAVKDASGDKVIQAVFDAALIKLDRFSRYASPKDAQDHRANRNGFGGVGLRFEMEGGNARITEVMAETPSREAGLKVGDVITRVEGEPLTGLDRDGLSHRLRGPVASDVGLTIRHQDGQEQTLSLRRSLIVPTTVTTVLHDGFAEFKISSFNQRTAMSLTSELATARATLGSSLKGVVLDMRGNPGGLLDQAVEVADLFIATGPIVTTKGRHPLSSQSYEARPGDIGEDVPVVVLVDGKSASAAEIVTGALQDAGRAVVIGTNSYGKGTVQTVLRLPNDGEMTLTWSRFYTPSGYALHGLGVLPAICTADEKAVPDTLIASVVDSPAPAMVSLNLAQWRAVPLGDTDQRKRLRGTCPSAKQGDLALDMTLAEKLLGNNAAYAKALAVSARPAAIPATAAGPIPVAPDAAAQALH